MATARVCSAPATRPIGNREGRRATKGRKKEKKTKRKREKGQSKKKGVGEDRRDSLHVLLPREIAAAFILRSTLSFLDYILFLVP